MSYDNSVLAGITWSRGDTIPQNKTASFAVSSHAHLDAWSEAITTRAVDRSARRDGVTANLYENI
jgi:hypothetical protein